MKDEKDDGRQTMDDLRFDSIRIADIDPQRKRRIGMITGLAGASIWSEDLNNLLPFYRDVLGLKVTMESPRYVILGGDESNRPTLALASHSEVHGRNPDPARHMVALLSDDIHADFQRLKAAGVEFVQEPNFEDGLTLATLKDPEGNLVQLFQF
jgi:catechol 2,3-dioxygenase-like lactoylglutathione lyase family enzyme